MADTLEVNAPDNEIEVLASTQVLDVALAGPQGPPGAAANSGFNYVQTMPSTTWIINHNLGINPNIQIFDIGGAQIGGDILHISLNQARLSFAVAVAGSARLS